MSGHRIRRNNRDWRKRRKRQLMIRIAGGVILLLMTILIIAGIVTNHKEPEKKQKKAKTTMEQTDTDSMEVKAEPEKETYPYPQKSSDYVEITAPEVRSPYVALVDVDQHLLIAGRNTETLIYPASMTKVMSLIVAVEHLTDLQQTFTMTQDIVDPLVIEEASRAGFAAGDTVTARDMLYGLILPSGADAAVGLAIMTAGSEEAFAGLMNEKCQELGLKNTHFVNASGLHDLSQYTTPVEMAMILAYAMENDTCREVLSTYQYTTAPLASNPEGILLTSTMFGRMYGNEVENVIINAGKTGYTQEARNCLVSYATKGDHHYVALTAGAENRWYVIYDDFELYGKYLP